MWVFHVKYTHEHYYHTDAATAGRQRRMEHMLGEILNKLESIMTAMDDLNAAVQRNTDAESAVVTLLNGISQQLKDALAANDPAAIKAVIDKIDANTAAAAAAVVANTTP